MPHALSPLPAKDFGYEEAGHLLRRAGFGGTPPQILALSNMGLNEAVDHLLLWERVPDNSSATKFRSDIMYPLEQSQRQRDTTRTPRWGRDHARRVPQCSPSTPA